MGPKKLGASNIGFFGAPEVVIGDERALLLFDEGLLELLEVEEVELAVDSCVDGNDVGLLGGTAGVGDFVVAGAGDPVFSTFDLILS